MNADYFGMDRAFPEFKLSPIQQLAKEMGITEYELKGFVNCLKVWTDKGLSIEEAISKHMAQMTRLVNNSVKVAHDPSVKELVVDAFYPS